MADIEDGEGLEVEDRGLEGELDDFIMAIQAAEEVQVRHGLPSLSSTTPFGSVFGGSSDFLFGSKLMGVGGSRILEKPCGKRFDGIAGRHGGRKRRGKMEEMKLQTWFQVENAEEAREFGDVDPARSICFTAGSFLNLSMLNLFKRLSSCFFSRLMLEVFKSLAAQLMLPCDRHLSTQF